MRLFVLCRHTDVSGVSGVGVVAEGCQFSDLSVVLRWPHDEYPASAVWPSIEAVEAIHGHQGATHVVWVPDPFPFSDEDVSEAVEDDHARTAT